MIPKVIHYCWFGGQALPYTARRCLKSWEKQCPDYEIKRWDESNFDVTQHPFMASAYTAGAWAFVSDWARLKILYDHGGIYLDTDVKLLKSLDSLLDNDFYIGVGQSGRLCNTGLGFGSVRGSKILLGMLSKYDSLLFDWNVAKELACPHLNDSVVRSYGYKGDGTGEVVRVAGLTVYPCRYFDPICPGDSENLLSSDSVCMSLYANSWGTRSDRMRRQLFTVIGAQNVETIKHLFRRR